MNNIKKIAECIKSEGMDAILLLDEFNRRYATGFPSSAGAVLITAEKSYFMTDGRYIEAAERAVCDAEVMNIKSGMKYTSVVADILKKSGKVKLGFEDVTISHRDFLAYSEETKCEMVAAEDILLNLRALKTAEEIEIMQKAQDITDLAFKEILKKINSEMTEKELAAEIIYALHKNGGDKISFDPIVVSGTNSSSPHGVPGNDKLSGFVTMDFGCIFNGYCSDMTRTVCVGKATHEMKKVYDTVLQAQLSGIKAARAGITGAEIDKAGRKVIDEAGYGQYFTHSFGHSVGLEVHDGKLVAAPSCKDSLGAGFAVSAEPGIYIPGKFGVRIEDVIVLTEDEAINLTKSPKELIEL